MNDNNLLGLYLLNKKQSEANVLLWCVFVGVTSLSSLFFWLPSKVGGQITEMSNNSHKFHSLTSGHSGGIFVFNRRFFESLEFVEFVDVCMV